LALESSIRKFLALRRDLRGPLVSEIVNRAQLWPGIRVRSLHVIARRI